MAYLGSSVLLELLLVLGRWCSSCWLDRIVAPYLCLRVGKAGGCIWSRFYCVALCFIVWFSSHLAGGRGTGPFVCMALSVF